MIFSLPAFVDRVIDANSLLNQLMLSRDKEMNKEQNDVLFAVTIENNRFFYVNSLLPSASGESH